MISIEQFMDLLAQEQDLETVVLASHAAADSPEAVEVADTTGLDRDYVLELTQRAIELGLVESEQSQGHEVTLTAQGRRLAERIQASYAQGSRRTEAIRRGVLESFGTQPRLSSQDVAEQWPGRPLEPAPTHDEIYDAYEYLRDQKMIKVQGTAQRVWLGMRLENAGRDALENRQRLVTPQAATSVANHSSHSQTFNQQGATIGAQAVGDHNTVSGSVTVAGESLAQIRQALSDALAQVDELPQEHQAPVREALEVAATVADEDEPHGGVLRTVLRAASQAAGAAVGTTAGQTIMGLVTSAAAVV